MCSVHHPTSCGPQAWVLRPWPGVQTEAGLILCDMACTACRIHIHVVSSGTVCGSTCHKVVPWKLRAGTRAAAMSKEGACSVVVKVLFLWLTMLSVGLWLVACGLWLVACGLWLVACCRTWRVARGGLWLPHLGRHTTPPPQQTKVRAAMQQGGCCVVCLIDTCWCPADGSERMDTDTFLAQHTAPLRDWPAEDVFEYFATSAKLRPVLDALPSDHEFRSVKGAYMCDALGTFVERDLVHAVSDRLLVGMEMRGLMQKLQERGTCSCFLAGCVCCCSCGP